jgi:hypothetical protein
MPDSLLKAPTFNNVPSSAVPAGTVAVCDLPRDRRYHTLFITATAVSGGTATANAADVIQEINLTINGKSQRRLTPAQLRAMNAFNGAGYNGSDLNTLVVHLREPWFTDPKDQHALSWGMGGVTSFRIEVTLKSGITSTVILGSYVADEGRDDKGNLIGIGVIKKTKSDFVGVSTTGDILVRNLSFEGFVKRMHFESSAISAIDFRANGRTVFEVATSNLAAFYAAQGLTAISGYTTVNFDELNHLILGVDAASLANSEIKVTNQTATSFNILHEFLAPALLS